MQTITACFSGPFGWQPRPGVDSIFEAAVGKESGIYLWTINVADGELIYYIGETGKNFAERMRTHRREHLAGQYNVFEPNAFLKGEKNEIWHGKYPKRANFQQDLDSRLTEIKPAIDTLAKVYRFFVAPLKLEERLRRRAEGAIARHLWNSSRNFQDSDVKYPRARQANEVELQLRITANVRLIDLPEYLSI